MIKAPLTLSGLHSKATRNQPQGTNKRKKVKKQMATILNFPKASFLTSFCPCDECAVKTAHPDRCIDCDGKSSTHHRLKNNNCCVEYTPEATRAQNIFDGADLTDNYNLPAFYSETMRTHKKAWKALTEQFNASTTMHGAISILWDNGIKCHSWCRMD